MIVVDLRAIAARIHHDHGIRARYIGSEPGSGAQHVARWPSGEEFIRPQLTPTSLGPPQAVSRLLTQED